MFLPPAVMMMSFLRSVMRRKPSCVELADVAGVQPAVGVDGLGAGLGVLEVAQEHAGRAREDLAVVGDAQLDAGQRPADGADAHVVGRRVRAHRGVLGLPVALAHGDAERPEELEHLRRDRRGARDRHAHAAQAELLAQGPEQRGRGQRGLRAPRRPEASLHALPGEPLATTRPRAVRGPLERARRRPCGSGPTPASSPTPAARRGRTSAARRAGPGRRTRRPRRS